MYGAMTGAQDHFQHTYVGTPLLDLLDGYESDFSQNGTYSSNLFTEKAIEVIQSSVESDQPLLLYLAYTATHHPVQAPEADFTSCLGIADPVRKRYCAMAVNMDKNLFKIFDVLNATGMWNNTVLVFTADNGGNVGYEPQFYGGNNFPLRGQKIEHWEGGIRVNTIVASPLIPSQLRGSIDMTTFMHHADWYATFLRLAGLQPDPAVDSIDQWDAITKVSPPQRSQIVSIWTQQQEYPYDTSYCRRGDWKLLVNANTSSLTTLPPEMTAPSLLRISTTDTPGTSASAVWGSLTNAFLSRFNRLPARSMENETYFLVDLATDPYETTDLSALHPDIVADFRAEIEDAYLRAVEPCNQEDPMCKPTGATIVPWS